MESAINFEEKLKGELDWTLSIYNILSLALDIIPHKELSGKFKAVMSGMSWMMSALEVITSGLELKKISKESAAFNNWKMAFHKWQKKHQPVFIETEKGLYLKKNFQPPLAPILSKKEHIKTLWAIIEKAENLEEIRNQLKDFGIEIDPKLPSKKELIILLKKDQDYFFRELALPYLSFQKTLESLNQVIQSSKDLLTKRKTIVEKKLLLLKPHFLTMEPKIKELKRASFKQSNPTASKKQFQTWYKKQSQDDLLRFYIDHQETIESTTKNALKEMVSKKYEIETKFINFKLTRSSLAFSLATISLTVGCTLAVIGLLTSPVGGAGLILLILSIGSIATSFGISGAGLYQAYREKPEATGAFFKGIQLKILWTQLQQAIQNYFHQSKEKKLVEVAKILHNLQQSTMQKEEPKYQEAFIAYKKAKTDFEQSQERVQKWNQKLQHLQNGLAKKHWHDFARQASLKSSESLESFDTLRAFNEALQACDLRLLSDETKTLLKMQLGLDLETLQAEVKKSAENNPETIKNALQKFFILDDAGLISFIEAQQDLIKKGV